MYETMSGNLSHIFYKALLITLLLSALSYYSSEARENGGVNNYYSNKRENKRFNRYYSIRLEFAKVNGNSLFATGDKIFLYRAKWGEEIAVDSAIISKEGIANFSGPKKGVGEYVIKKGKKVVAEFFISNAESRMNEVYSIDSDATGKELKVSHKMGSVENALFMNLQNYLFSALNYKTDPKKISVAIDSISLEIANKCKGSILDIMCRLSMNPNSGKPSYIRDNFPFKENRIIYTRFGKSVIENYLEVVRLNTNEAIEFLADDLIEAASDPLKPFIASTIFHKFEESDIMGQEAVAVYVAKRYFGEGKLKWPGEEEEFLAGAFVHMNENSLIGMKAPTITMKDTSGYSIPFDSIGGEYKILYFYSADCKTCRIETPKLAKFLKEYSGAPISVYAVFTDSSREHWIKYIKDNFKNDNRSVKWINVWDPAIESNFPLLYGVISTPQLFLIDMQGTIIGRRLRTDSLKELLKIKNNN
jgi:peroxiredoxin